MAESLYRPNERDEQGLVPPPHTTPQPITTQRPTNARVVVVEQIYFQSADGMPVANEVRFSRQIKSDEQPYQRRIKVGKEWQALDCGWIEECGLLVVEHESPNWQVNPTEQERKDALERVVEIGKDMWDETHMTVISHIGYILIGESTRFSPGDVSVIRLRCNTDTRVKVTLYPK